MSTERELLAKAAEAYRHIMSCQCCADGEACQIGDEAQATFAKIEAHLKSAPPPVEAKQAEEGVKG
jgi:hypothetical protein